MKRNLPMMVAGVIAATIASVAAHAADIVDTAAAAKFNAKQL